MTTRRTIGRRVRNGAGSGESSARRKTRAASTTGPLVAALRATIAESARLAAGAADHAEPLAAAVDLAVQALRGGNQVVFCGNGGSAAQALHLAAELSGRFYIDREPLRAHALTENVPALTAIANDYGYEHVFSRQLLAVARAGDVLVALSTSGASPNIRRVVETAHRIGVKTIGLTGGRGAEFAHACDLGFVVPTIDPARIQEVHLLLGHLFCASIEAVLFPRVPSRSGRS